MSQHALPDEQKKGLYRAIYERRDVRSQFLPDPVPEDVLARLLDAAHHAPSVGFMQPWDFILIDCTKIRQAVKKSYTQAKAAANHYQDERAALYDSLKLEGITDSPINLCITCDRSRGGEHVLGRDSMYDTDLFSTSLAVQNLWLAARAEGIGVGWVSILDPDELSRILGLPEHVYPLAYLCIGYVSEFLPEPELARKGWRQRLPLDKLVHANRWQEPLVDNEIITAIEKVST